MQDASEPVELKRLIPIGRLDYILIMVGNWKSVIKILNLRIVFLFVLLSCGVAAANTSDCSAPPNALPGSVTRVYIALRNGVDGSGKSITDARDGSTVSAFDRILRCYSEGCRDPKDLQKSVPKTENLIVCLGPGTFSTLGNYDYVINIPHTDPAGFTIGKGWKIHGAGKDKTVLKLSDYLRITAPGNPQNMPENVGANVVFSTNSDDASGVEISDLTIDGNYPDLKSRSRAQGLRAIGLEAIHLRSDGGRNWIHDVNVIRLGLEIGQIGGQWEAFPIWIVSINNKSPDQDRGNIIENVVMTQSFGGACTSIAIANAVAEVRNNVVEGYGIGYGGWSLGETVFHDNTAINTEYGFNIDSLVNRGVRIENNRIIHPRLYGVVVGGDGTYADFRFLNNKIEIDRAGVIGFVLRGNVKGAIIISNKILSDNPYGPHAMAIRSYAGDKLSGPNVADAYESNVIAAGMAVSFNTSFEKAQNCFFDNRDEYGNALKDLPDNHNGSCPVSLPH